MNNEIRTEQQLRLNVLELATNIACTQAAENSGNTKNDVNILQDTLRNAKKLWKFVKSDPLVEKEESE